MTISLPPALAKDFERLAREQAKTKSQLFRDILAFYRTQALERQFFELQRYGAGLAEAKGILTEEEVERIVFQDR